MLGPGEHSDLLLGLPHHVLQVLQEAGAVCTAMGQNIVQYEVSMEQLVVLSWTPS